MYSDTTDLTNLNEYAKQFTQLSDQLHEGQRLPLIFKGQSFCLERIGNSYVMMLPILIPLENLPHVIHIAQICCEKVDATEISLPIENPVVFQALILKEKIMLVAVRKKPCLDDLATLDWARTAINSTFI